MWLCQSPALVKRRATLIVDVMRQCRKQQLGQAQGTSLFTSAGYNSYNYNRRRCVKLIDQMRLLDPNMYGIKKTENEICKMTFSPETSTALMSKGIVTVLWKSNRHV